MPTKRDKLVAMATQTESPNEAAIAKRKLAATPESRLDVIATDIKVEYGKGIEAQFAIGRLLNEARAMFPGDTEFGKWSAEQGFPFKAVTSWYLRAGAEREDEVRKFIALQSGEGRDIGVASAIKELTAGPKPTTGEATPVTDVTPVDPAYAALRAAHRAIVGEGDTNAFLTMHVEDLVKSAGFIKELAGAYTAAKAERNG